MDERDLGGGCCHVGCIEFGMKFVPSVQGSQRRVRVGENVTSFEVHLQGMGRFSVSYQIYDFMPRNEMLLTLHPWILGHGIVSASLDVHDDFLEISSRGSMLELKTARKAGAGEFHWHSK